LLKDVLVGLLNRNIEVHLHPSGGLRFAPGSAEAAAYLELLLIILGRASTGPRQCPDCGTIFEGPRHKRYCSDACRWRARPSRRRGESGPSSSP
jgi:hypothetical protein